MSRSLLQVGGFAPLPTRSRKPYNDCHTEEPMPTATDTLETFLPPELCELGDLQTAIPRIAKDRKLTRLISLAVREIPTTHDLRRGDARAIEMAPESVHL